MKLTVLGCWAPYPRAGGACSGYLLEDGGENILVECGNGVLSNLQKYIDFRRLDAVIISHWHPDHYMDLYCLRHAISGARRLEPQMKPLPLFAPGVPEETFTKISHYKDSFQVTPVERLPATQVNGISVYETFIGRIRISFTGTDHPMPAYAMRFEANGKLFYSADTRWNDNLADFASGVDLALCEASVIEEDRDYTSVGHLTARQAGSLARAACAGQFMATHFWPEYDLETIRAEAESGFKDKTILAREGLEVQVEPFALLQAPSPKMI
ncbi:MAG: MBL fold metallo-hydrolase [Firmicutes bacterium HGW-Firmicutes-14]|nr:MAG: MBL fold metallo-hydrolase [Firmicutes bacterium HGW-Firmicutes-14]